MARLSSSSWRDISSAVEFVPSPAAIGLVLLLSYSLLLSSTCNAAATSRIGNGSAASSDHEPDSGNGHQEPFIDYNEGNNFDFNQDHVFAVDDNSTEDGLNSTKTHDESARFPVDAPQYRTQSTPLPPATSAEGSGYVRTQSHPTPGHVPPGETLSVDNDYGTTKKRWDREYGGIHEGSGVGIGPGASSAEPFTATADWSPSTKGSTIAGQMTEKSTNDGYTTNGSITDGSTSDGYTTNGSISDGSTSDGYTTNGSISDGSTSDGSTTEGSATEGSTTDGSTTDGSTTDGSTTDGSTTDGSTTDGSTTDGSTTDGSTTYGSTTDGSKTDGSTTDGSTTYGPTTDALTTHILMTGVSSYGSTTAGLIHDHSRNSRILKPTDDPFSSNLPAAVPTVSTITPPNIPCPNITKPYKFSKCQEESSSIGSQGVDRTTTVLKLTIVGTCHHKQANSSIGSKRSINDHLLTQNTFSSSWQYNRLTRMPCWIGASADSHVEKCEFESSTKISTSTTYDDSSCQITSTITLLADQGFQHVGTFKLSRISYSCRPEPGTSGGVDARGPSGDRLLSMLDYSGLSLAVGMQKIPENDGPFNIGLTLVIFLIIAAGIIIACVMASKRVKCDRTSWTISNSRNNTLPPTNDIPLVEAADTKAGASDGIATGNGENHVAQHEILIVGTDITDDRSGKSAYSRHDNGVSKKSIDRVNQKDEVEDEQKSSTEREQEFDYKNANDDVNAENKQILKTEPDHGSENPNGNTDVQDINELDLRKRKFVEFRTEKADQNAALPKWRFVPFSSQ